MTVIEWDKIGDRTYQTGVDRGVLYLKDGTVVPWNGLTQLEDGSVPELKSYYLDGVKILDHVTPGDYSGKLSAFTYPEEFEQCIGNEEIHSGLTFYEQKSKRFNLSYRTRIASDLDPDYGYKIHLLFNMSAVPEAQKFQTLDNSPSAGEMTWTLSGTPQYQTIDGIRPPVHVSVDSINTDPTILATLEGILYGTPTADPRFPTLLELRLMFGEVGGLYIIDNGDGTWTALDPSDDFVTMLDSETFQIAHANATFTDPPVNDTYTITDTPLPLP